MSGAFLGRHLVLRGTVAHGTRFAAASDVEYAPPRATIKAAPSQKRFVCSAGETSVTRSRKRLWFPLAGRRGYVSPALSELSVKVVCPLCAASPSPPNYNARKFRYALELCGARARSRSARLPSRVPSPRTPLAPKMVLCFAPGAHLLAAAPGGSCRAAYEPNLISLSL